MGKIDARISAAGEQAVAAEIERIKQAEQLAQFTPSDFLRRLLTDYFGGVVDFSVKERGGKRPGAGRKPKGEQS